MATATIGPSTWWEINGGSGNDEGGALTGNATLGNISEVEGDPWKYRAIALFDLSSIPAGSTINSIKLRVQRIAGSSAHYADPWWEFDSNWVGDDLILHGLTRDLTYSAPYPAWTNYASGQAWTTPGGDGVQLGTYEFDGTENAQYAEFTLATDVLDDYFGFILQGSGEWIGYPFRSNISVGTPSLVIDYTAPVGHLTLPEWIGECVMAEISAEQPLRFFLKNSDGTAGTGKSPTVEIRKHGAGAWATPIGAVSELGNGWYQVAYSAADQDTPGQLLLRATATGCDASGACYTVFGDTNPYTGTVDANVVSVAAGVKIDANLVSIDENDDATDEPTLTLKALYDGGVSRAAVSDYSPTTTSFLTTLPLEDPDHYADQAVVFTSGGLAGQTAHVDTSETEGSLTRLTLVAALTAAPADGDAIVVIGRLA